MFGAVLELWRLGSLHQRQVQQRNAAIRSIRQQEALVGKEFWVRKELTFAPFGAQDAKAPFPLCLGVLNAFIQKVAGIAMSFHGTGDPQAVDADIPLRLDGHPGVFRRNVLDEALPPFLTAVKNKSFGKPLFEPLFLCKALLAGHGAANMLLVDVVFRDADIVHASPSV